MIASSRADRRRAAKVAKHKPRRNDKSKCGAWVDGAIIKGGNAIFNEAFEELKQSADQLCLMSNDGEQISTNVGFFLYVILRGMELDQVEADDETSKALEKMKPVLCKVQESKKIHWTQRRVLTDGMDYLIPIAEVISIKAKAVAWSHVAAVTGIKNKE